MNYERLSFAAGRGPSRIRHRWLVGSQRHVCRGERARGQAARPDQQMEWLTRHRRCDREREAMDPFEAEETLCLE